MRFSLYTDYGLRILMYLAGQDGRATVGEIAAFFDISKDHVAKAAQHLARHGLIRSTRGIGGGLELARPADAVRVGEVVRVMEGSTHLLDCVVAESPVCVIQPGCKLRSVLAEAERVQMAYLDSVSLRDVVEPGVPLHQLKVESKG